jgi:hypothetical protein
MLNEESASGVSNDTSLKNKFYSMLQNSLHKDMIFIIQYTKYFRTSSLFALELKNIIKINQVLTPNNNNNNILSEVKQAYVHVCHWSL